MKNKGCPIWYSLTLIFYSLAAFGIYCYDCVVATLDQCNKGIGLEYMECFEPINYDKRVYGSQVACLKASGNGKLVL